MDHGPVFSGRPGYTHRLCGSLCCLQRKGDVTRNDSKRRFLEFLAQHSVVMLEECCDHSKQCRDNVARLCNREGGVGEAGVLPYKKVR